MATGTCHTSEHFISPAITRKFFIPCTISLRQSACDFGRSRVLDHRPYRLRCQSRISTDFNAPGEAQITSPPAIRIEDLRLSLTTPGGEKVRILENCSLEIPEGQLWMLLGPNGCGKSTLLKALAGLLKPDGGRMQAAGPRSFVFQNPDHQVVMPSVGADVAFGLGRQELTRDEIRKRVEESLRAVGMEEYMERPVQTLSGGQKQRVAIAGALAENSRVLLLDELTTFLDESDQVGVIEAVRNIIDANDNVTAVWVTHRLEELEYADGAIYMDKGKVVISGETSLVANHIRKLKKEAGV